ncbi:MAG: ATP-binding protein [Elusimicrobiota bacterium]
MAETFAEMARRVEEKVQELSREQTQLTAILSALIEGVIALDHQGRVLFLNPAGEALFGVQNASIRGGSFWEVLRHSPLNQLFDKTLRGQKPLTEEVVLFTPAERILSVHVLPVNYGDGQTGALAALHDITELRKLESIRQEFVANASHELKTPLTSIKGYVETLLEGALEDPKHNREFLKTIQLQTDHLMRLIEDLLDLSAIEARRIRYHFEPVSLKEVVEQIAQNVAPLAKAKPVTLDLRCSEDLPRVRADREKLGQIFMNLLDNAIKFNKPGGRVTVTASPGQGFVTVAVQDTGVGILPQDLPRVFERFFRTEKSHSHDIPGTGLGLAIVKHLVEAHQGSVTAESVPGQGSVFHFTIPLAIDQ